MRNPNLGLLITFWCAHSGTSWASLKLTCSTPSSLAASYWPSFCCSFPEAACGQGLSGWVNLLRSPFMKDNLPPSIGRFSSAWAGVQQRGWVFPAMSSWQNLQHPYQERDQSWDNTTVKQETEVCYETCDGQLHHYSRWSYSVQKVAGHYSTFKSFIWFICI